MYKKKFIRTNKKDFFINYLKILHKIKKYRNFAQHFYEIWHIKMPLIDNLSTYY